MRVAFDASPLDQRWATGVEKAFLGLLKALSARPGDHEFLLAAPRRPRLLPQFSDPRFRFCLLGGGTSRVLWRERLVPAFAHEQRVDIWHSPVQALPLLLDRPKVATLHEFSWCETAGVGDEGPLAKRRALSLVVARSADRILCVSERTRSHFVRQHPEAADRTRVIHHAVDAAFFAGGGDPERARRRYGIPAGRPYLLTVCRALKRKGMPHAMRAFRVFLDRTGADHLLVAAGPRTTAMLEALALGRRLGLAERLVPTGYVAEEDLPALYSGADAFLFPSESEGFGLPLLEAMAAGTPVVANAAASIPEVAGGAARLTDFTRALAAAQAIQEVTGAGRDTWVARGRARAAEFPPERLADRVLGLWDGLAA